MENVRQLTAGNVEETMQKCCYTDEEIRYDETENGIIPVIPTDAIVVDGITRKFAFHPSKLENQKEMIEAMINELPDVFKQGMSFLHLCTDKNNYQWADLHTTMEKLMALGIAIGKMEYCFPRELWKILPGGMPYILVKD